MTETNFEETINNNLFKILKNELRTLQNEAQLAIALSGGSDSLALTIALHQLRYNVLAILINHNLRIESKDEIDKTIKTISKYGIKYLVKEWDGKVKNNLENDARNARYKLLLDVCNRYKIKYLCLGHHMNDQSETFLLNLARGSGLDGLCCMPNIITINNIHIIRPMLNLTKQDCVNYLVSKTITWCEDSSNKDTKYKRNKIRYLLEQIEEKKLLTKRICTTVAILQEVRETIDIVIEQTTNKIASYNIDKYGNTLSISFKRNDFLNLTTYLQKSILTKFVMKLSGKIYKPRLYQIENILKDIKNKNHLKRTIANCFILIKNDSITIFVNSQQKN